MFLNTASAAELTVREQEEFLREYLDSFLAALLPAYRYTVEGIIDAHMSEELAEWMGIEEENA